jgi:hypothetical protein
MAFLFLGNGFLPDGSLLVTEKAVFYTMLAKKQKLKNVP